MELKPVNIDFLAYPNEFHSFLKGAKIFDSSYCLPNIILDNWNFTGFIDLDIAAIEVFG